jgi:DNA-binding transcriptional LysR family regulator
MLSLTHLKYFHDAALLDGVAAAAERNRVSASAVSQAVRNLEEHFGTALLKHARNRFELTPEGRLLVERARALLESVERLEEDVRWSTGANAGVVRFATQQSIAHHLLPNFLAHLTRAHPQLTPQIKLAPTDVVRRWIETREVDFGLSVDNIGHDSLVAAKIYEGRYVFVATPAVAARKERVFITPGADTREALTLRRAYEAAHGVAPRIVLEIKSWGVVKRFAALGMGIGLVPDYLMRFEPSPGLREIDLGLPVIPYRINAFWCGKRRELSRAARLFLDELEAFVRTL